MYSVKAIVLSCLPHPSPPDVSDFPPRETEDDPPRIAPADDVARSSGCSAGEHPPVNNQDRTTDGGQDKLSSLPQHLRSNIVARLPLRDALATREISKRWLRVWQSTPLSLDDDDDSSSDLAGCSRPDHRIRAITRILHMHPGPFRSVRLSSTWFAQARPMLRVWARVLASKGVRDLCLVNQPPPVDMDLPSEVLRCATLRRLWLAFFRFPSYAAINGHYSEEEEAACYPSLTELGLCATAIQPSDLEHMLRSSPALETLALVASYDQPMRVCLHGHPALRCVVLWMSIADEIDVDDTCLLQRLILWETRSSSASGGRPLTVKIARSPNLRVLGYLEPMYHKLQIGDTVIDAGTKVSSTAIVPSLQVLALKLCLNDKEQTKLLPCFLRCFPKISALHIESSDAAESENPTTTTTTTTTTAGNKLNRSYWKKHQADSIECLSRRVKRVYFHGFSARRSELAFLRFVLAEAAELELLVITLSEAGVDDADRINRKLVALGKSYRATEKELRMFVNPFGSGFTFRRAADCLEVDDPFFSMENLWVPPDDS